VILSLKRGIRLRFLFLSKIRINIEIMVQKIIIGVNRKKKSEIIITNYSKHLNQNNYSEEKKTVTAFFVFRERC